MSRADEDRVSILSARREVAIEVEAAFLRLGARPAVAAAPLDPDERLPGLAVLDLASRLSVEAVRRRLPVDGELVALAEAAAIRRLVPALAAGCSDYLFFPLNPDEVRLLWSRYRQGEPPRVLPLDRSVEGRFRLEFPSDPRCLHPAVRSVSTACAEAAEIGDEAAFRLRATLGEAVSNAILYGNREEPSRRVRVVGKAEPGAVVVTVADEGDGFDPEAVPDPSAKANVGRSSGRGLFLMRRLADRVRFNARGNEVTIEVRRRTGGPR